MVNMFTLSAHQQQSKQCSRHKHTHTQKQPYGEEGEVIGKYSVHERSPKPIKECARENCFPQFFFLGGGEHAKSQMLNQHMPVFLEGVALSFVQFFLWNVNHFIICRESMWVEVMAQQKTTISAAIFLCQAFCTFGCLKCRPKGATHIG